MAMAPPLTLILLVSQPISLFTAQACAAKASLISIRSRSCADQPARCRHSREAGTGPMPMMVGSSPADAYPRITASGRKPSAAARCALITSTAAAPSLSPDALPAVTLPALSKAGRNPASTSALVLRLTNSSAAKTTGSPFFCAMENGRISSANRPASCAAAAFCCEASASASCRSRVMPYCFATFSAVIPMWYWLKTSHRPSTIMLSISFASPMRKPSREPGSTCGAALMFSWPPATTISASPHLTACAASMTALSPEPHTLLMVIPGTLCGNPALMTVWRAGFWPAPAVNTWPMMTSLTASAGTPACASKPLTTWAPRSTAEVLASVPPNLPTAVRAAATMTISDMFTPSQWMMQKPKNGRLHNVFALVYVVVMFASRPPASMQFHVRLGAPHDQSRQRVERDLGKAVQREFVHLVERQVHPACEQAFDHQVAADQSPHHVADGAELAQRHQRAKIPVAVILERFARHPPPDLLHQMGSLLVRRLGAWRHEDVFAGLRPRTGCAVADGEDVVVAGYLQCWLHHQLVDPIRREAGDVLQEVRRLDAGCPDHEFGRQELAVGQAHAV